MDYAQNFCENLKYLRKIKCLSQERMAEILDIKKSDYIEMETIQCLTPPEYAVLEKLCRIFNVSANTLLFYNLKSDEVKCFSREELEEMIYDIDCAITEINNIKDFIEKRENQDA